MSYRKKIFSGQKPSEKDWEEFVKESHAKEPGMSPRLFERLSDGQGKNTYEILSSSMNLGEDSRVLDLACGNGVLSKYLLLNGRCALVDGVDFSPEEIAAAQENFNRSNVQFHLAAAQKMPFENQKFDCCLSHMAVMLITPLEELSLIHI